MSGKATTQDFKILTSASGNPPTGFVRRYYKSGGMVLKDETGGEMFFQPFSPDDATIESNSGTLRLKDGGVVAAKLAAGAVETAKIKDANVTTAKLAADAVETAKIKDANVTTAKLATGERMNQTNIELNLIGEISTHSHEEQIAAENGIIGAASTLWKKDDGKIVTFVYDENDSSKQPDAKVSLLIHGQNNVTDRSQNGLTVTPSNITYNETTYQFGDYSIEFNGSDGKLMVADSAALSPSSAFLLAGFFRFDAVTGTRTLFSKESADDSAKEYRLEISTTKGIVFKWAEDAGAWDKEISKLWSPSIGTWYWICFAYDGSDYYIIVDNSVLETATYSISIYDGTNDLLIGESPVAGSENRLDGKAQEFLVVKGYWSAITDDDFDWLDTTSPAVPTDMHYVTRKYAISNVVIPSSLTASRALETDASGSIKASSVTSTELGYVSGVTSEIQTQLNGKAASGANADITSMTALTSVQLSSTLNFTGDEAQVFLESEDYDIVRLGYSSSVDRGYVSGLNSGTVGFFLDSGGDSYFNGGNIGIGTTTPSDDLEIYRATGEASIETRSDELSSSTDTFYHAVGKKSGGDYRRFRAGVAYNYSSDSNETCAYLYMDPGDGDPGSYLWIDDSDRLRISKLYVHLGTTNGTVVGDQTSDERLKNIVGECRYGLSEILALNTIEFTFREDPDVNLIGFGALETEAIIPEAVYSTGETIDDTGVHKRVMRDYVFTPVIVNAIKELNDKITKLEETVR